MLANPRIRFATKIASCHFVINIFVAIAVAVLVFYVWYPYPYRQMLGGVGLFALIVGIDAVCGPVLTAVLANPKKSRREMLVDIVLVAIIQLSALVYGLHTVAVARPVAVAFEVDRFVVVSSVDIHQESLAKAAAPFNRLPWFGPERVAIARHMTLQKKIQISLFRCRGLSLVCVRIGGRQIAAKLEKLSGKEYSRYPGCSSITRKI